MSFESFATSDLQRLDANVLAGPTELDTLRYLNGS
jgi:hypothetical protein